MENLVLLGEERRKLELSSLEEDALIVDVVPVDDSDGGYVVLTQNGTVAKLAVDNSIQWTCSLKEESSDWFSVFWNDPEVVCLSKQGAIVTIDAASGEYEVIGVFDQGLDDAAWSSDGETMAMVTSIEDDEPTAPSETINSRLMTMNTQFEVLAEVTIPRHSSEHPVSLAWRPDSTLLAVSSVDEEDGVRKIRIYRRETLELHAIGRAEDASGTLVKNLQPSTIAWAGAGCSQLLAGVQRKGKKTHQVVFFEPNGL